MNKLLVPNGGMPLFGNDFAFLDLAQRDAIKGILYEIAKPYNGDLVLGGCDFSSTSTTITVTAGYVLINYEVHYFPGVTVADTTGNGFMEPDIFFDPAGLKSFANGSSQNTYQVRRAKFTAGSLVGGTLDFPGAVRLSASLYDLMKMYVTSSSTISVYNSWIKYTPNLPKLNKHFRYVQFTGGFQVGDINGATFTKIALLPVLFRPASTIEVVCSAQGTGFFGNMVIRVVTNGEVYAILTDTQDYTLLSVNITFLTP